MALAQGLIRQLSEFSSLLLTDFKRLFPISKCSPCTADSPFPLNLKVPNGEELRCALLRVGAPQKLAEEITSIHVERAENLARDYTQLHEQACASLRGYLDRDVLVLRAQKLVQRYEAKVNAWAADSICMGSKRFRRKERGDEAQEKRVFNRSFVPILERCYSISQIPSQADKAFLARKSGMSVQQINIWFQNRRARRKGESESGTIPRTLLTADRKAVGSLGSKSSKASKVSMQVSGNSTSQQSVEIFNGAPPAHAFPLPYPPEGLSYDPFPCRHGEPTRFPKPLWRHTSHSRISSQLGIDWDGLIASLARLHLSDPPLVKKNVEAAYVSTNCGLPIRQSQSIVLDSSVSERACPDDADEHTTQPLSDLRSLKANESNCGARTLTKRRLSEELTSQSCQARSSKRAKCDHTEVTVEDARKRNKSAKPSTETPCSANASRLVDSDNLKTAFPSDLAPPFIDTAWPLGFDMTCSLFNFSDFLSARKPAIAIVA